MTHEFQSWLINILFHFLRKRAREIVSFPFEKCGRIHAFYRHLSISQKVLVMTSYPYFTTNFHIAKNSLEISLQRRYNNKQIATYCALLKVHFQYHVSVSESCVFSVRSEYVIETFYHVATMTFTMMCLYALLIPLAMFSSFQQCVLLVTKSGFFFQ